MYFKTYLIVDMDCGQLCDFLPGQPVLLLDSPELVVVPP